MIDSGIEILQKRVQQVAGLVERLKEENNNLKEQMAKMEDEIFTLREELKALKEERELIKSKIDSAIAMFDELGIELGDKEESTNSDL